MHQSLIAAPLMATRMPTPPAVEAEKSRFLARNRDRCSYLAVDADRDPLHAELLLSASFTFDLDRRWHRVEARLPLAALDGGDSGAALVAGAFAMLDEGIGAARIAELFAPRPAASGMAIGRR